MMLGITGAMASGCGSDESVVGGQCVSGYSPCGGTCCSTALDGSADGSAGSSPDGGSVDGSSDGGDRNGDGAQRVQGDASADASRLQGAADGAPFASDSGSVSTEDGSADDAATGGDVLGTDADDSGDEPDVFSCALPLVDCGGVCVDLTTNPSHCGACPISCPSQICEDSLCVGSTVGGLVYIGHDFARDPASPGPAEVLSNALFMSRSNPLHVMSYERHAQPVAVLSADAVMFGTAALFGRQVSLTSTVTDADIPAKLMSDHYDVLVVHDQTSAAPGDMAELGTGWAATLTSFTSRYGIVVILDGGTGVGEMPQFSTATGLLQVSAHSVLSPGSPLQVLSPGDAVGIGVVSPYAASASSVFLGAEPNGGNVAYVVGGMEPGQGPVVIHKVF